MKKHVWGLLVFGCIFGLTAVAVTLLYQPNLPVINSIESPAPENIEPTSCFPRAVSLIDTELLNSRIDLDNDKILTVIKLSWNKKSAPPSKIYFKIDYFKSGSLEKNEFQTLRTIDAPFKNGNQAEITSEENINEWKDFDKSENYYAAAEISENPLDGNSIKTEIKKARSLNILLIHGRSSQK